MTTPDQIQLAYSSTSQCSWCFKIEDCLNNKNGMRSNTIHEILRYLRLEGNLFGCEGPVDRFVAIYKIGEFEIVVQSFDCSNDVRVHTVQGFADWLNECERKILMAAEQLIEDKK